MTEKEFLLEMLCCLPKETLLLKLDNSTEIPKWLKNIDNHIVREAIDKYDSKKYSEHRELVLKYI